VVGRVADFLIDNSLFSQRKRFHESDFIMTSHVASQPALAGGSGELYRAPKADSL
jgi:hypothetical protein